MKSPSVATDEILMLLRTHGQGDYIGESISQLEHCLQCAYQARSHGANEDTVLAALLHDIGQFLPAEDVQQLLGQEVQDMRSTSTTAAFSKSADNTTPHPDSGSVGRVGHETIGASYLASLNFSAKVCALVGSHVAAKRYLCAVDPAYYDTLSDASKRSLEVQGGPMRSPELEEWSSSELCDEMCSLRRWDDKAKVVGLEVDGIESYKDAIQRHLEKREKIGSDHV